MFIRDFKYALRLLLKRPGFTALTIAVMVAGIGLSVYLFSFMHTMVFKPLPFDDGESLVRISASKNGARGFGSPINLHDYYEIRTNLDGVSEFGAYKDINVNVSGRDGAQRYDAVLAEPNIFQLTRIEPVLGRAFTAAENRRGAEYVVVISYDLWQNRFRGEESAIGQTLRINGDTHRIIGVMPPGYAFPSSPDLWLPTRQDATDLTRGNSDAFFGLAHLDDGVSMEEVNRELAVIMQRLGERYPKTNDGIGAYVDTLQMANVGDGIAVVYAMHVAAILILLLASTNVGNLMLSRAVERQKETAIRVALGAPRSRLITQMLWESVIICTVGGIIALLLIGWGLEATEAVTASFFVDEPSFWWRFGIDGFAVTLTLGFVLGTVLLTGFLPAWRATGSDFNAALRDGTRGALGKKAGRLNRGLVVSEILLSVTILIIASVIVLGTYLTTQSDYGAETEDILMARVLLAESKYETPEMQAQFAAALQSRLENSSGVGNVMIATAMPGQFSSTPTIALQGKEYTQEGQGSYPRANYIAVTPGSLEKLGIELKDGRYFNNGDDGFEKRSIIVTESFVARHFANRSPIGQRLRIMELDGDEPQWLPIIGVVEHTIQGLPNEASGKMPSIFRPFGQAPQSQMEIAMEMKADRATATRTLRETLASIDPELPAFRIKTYAENIARVTAPLKFISTVFLLFGIAAVGLAASGIYGVMSNTIHQSTQEIGVKRALGATEERVTKEYLMTGVKRLLWGGIPGLAAGCAIGFAMSRIMGAGNSDLLIIAITMVTVTSSVVLLATYLPTRRALQMEPSEALRYE